MRIVLKKELSGLKKIFLGSDDAVTKQFSAGGTEVCLFYIDGLTDRELLEANVVRPLMQAKKIEPPYAGVLEQILLYAEKPKSVKKQSEVADAVAAGDIALLVDGATEFFVLSLRKFERRGVAEPPTSTVIKGPREGFVEDIKTNLTMLRRRLKTPKLAVKNLNVGRYSNTAVSVVYVSDIADEKVVKKVLERIEKIDIDGIIDSSYIARYLEERKFSIFQETGTSEKPDSVAAKILEGRVAIIVDGSPIVVTVPYILMEDFQDAYDYYSKDAVVTLTRVLRLLGAMFTVILPAMYVAFTTSLYYMLPLKFLVTIMNALGGIPFPSPIETVIVILLFDILNQASQRMPRYLGISLSVVGAIVLGDTAVKAGLISSSAVLIAALSSIGLFCIPDQVGTFSLLRLGFIFVASVLGLYGITVAVIMLICYLSNMQSYGAPYLAPYAPLITQDLKDGLIKSTLFDMKTRPRSFPNKNRKRISVPNESVDKKSAREG